MQKQCTIILWLLALCAALQTFFFILAWSTALPPGLFMQMSATGLDVAQMRALGPGQRLAGAALGLPALLALLYGLWRLRSMLANVRRRLLFDLGTIAHLRAFAGAVLASTLLSVVEPLLRALVFRAGFGDAKAALSVGVTGEGLVLVLVCGLFYVVTGLMHEARRLAEDNEGFV